MYIQVHTPDKSTKNAGSSNSLISYLEKENVGLDIVNEEPFFSHEEDAVSGSKAQLNLDTNHKGLKANDSKFYMITINPSESELKHINNDPDKLKEYTRQVMDQYAKGFNRTIDGKEMTGKDLVYFAKIENNRRYDPKDKKFENDFKQNIDIRNKISELKREIKSNPDRINSNSKEITKMESTYIRDRDNGIILPGNNKPGLNTHIHVVVSRKDAQQKVALSPFANSRGSKNELNGKKVQIGFDRKDFVNNCEKQFDTKFQYQREMKDKFEVKHAQKHDTAKYIREIVKMPTDPKAIAKKIVTEMFDKDKKIQKMLDPLKRVPKNAQQINAKIQDKAIDAVAKLIAGGANPTAMAIKAVIQKTIQISIGSGGMSL